MTVKRKTWAELSAENTAFRMVVDDLLNIIEEPGKYHMRFEHDPSNKRPGLSGAKAICTRAKKLLGRTQGNSPV